MIKVEKKIFNELAGRFEIAAGDLEYLAGGREDNDGIVYTYVKNQKKYVLKICAKEEQRDVDRARIKLELTRFLGEQGLTVAYPNCGDDGKVFQVLKEGKYYYFASIADYIEGSTLKTAELDKKTVFECGRVTGKLHAATKKYSIWESIPGGKFQWGIEEEIDGFYHWCRNDIVKEKWQEIAKEMKSWEKNRNSYGFIHNDNHQNNILMDGNKLTLIDYDCAECTYMLQDILIPVQGILFDQAGGIDRPFSDLEVVKRFYESFLSGYETENHIEDIWLTRLETLLNYRRLLLFTVMQEWMESEETVRDRFLGMIQNPCKFSIV